MSAEASGWVYRYSPYKGVPFAIHLAIADSVNDQHDDEFWMRQTVLAKKARTTRGTVNTAIAEMLTDGMIELISEGSGGANRYRFLMPDGTPEVFNPRSRVSPGGTPSRGERAGGCTAAGQGGVPPTRTEPKGDPKGEPKPNPASEDELFAAFYAAYPRKVGRGEARKAWTTARKKASADEIMAGLERYGLEVRGKEARYIKHPGPWLNAERWADEPGATAGGGGAQRGHGRPIDTNRDADDGELDL